MRKQKTVIYAALASVAFILVMVGVAQAQNNGPLNILQAAVTNLQADLQQLQNRIDTIERTPGPPGLRGPPGEPSNITVLINNQLETNEEIETVMFLFVDGIQGESTDGNHTNWIDVLSYNVGV